MSDAKSQDHWKDIAQLLGAEVPEEPEEEPAVEGGVAEESTPAVSDTLADESEARQESGEQVPAVVGPIKPAAEPPRPRPPARRPDPNHWRTVAGALGIEVPEEEIEEPEEKEEEVVAAADVEASGIAEPRAEETGEEETGERFPEPAAVQEAEDAEWVPEAEMPEPASPVDEPMSPPDRPTRSVPSLFDDVRLSLDTPWALDRIFEDEERAVPAPPAGFEEREAFGELGDDFEDADELSSFDDEVEEADEVEEVEDGELGTAAAQPVVTDEEGEEPRRRRRRRRRRRKGAKPEQETEKGTDETEDREPAEESSDVADDDSDSLHDEDDDEPSTLGIKHRKIPTWDEAVGVVISANLDSRAKNPNGGSRGKGRGRGRRS